MSSKAKAMISKEPKGVKSGFKFVRKEKAKTPTPKKQSKLVKALLELPKITNSRKGAEALAKKLPAFRLRAGTGNSSSGNYFYTERRINGKQYTVDLRTLARAQRLAKTDPQKVIDDPFPPTDDIERLARMLKFKLEKNPEDFVNPIIYPD